MSAVQIIKKFGSEIKSRKRVRLSRSAGGTFAIFLFLIIMGVFMALPLVYSVVQAFKPINELFAYPPKFFVKNPTLDNFYQVFELANNPPEVFVVELLNKEPVLFEILPKRPPVLVLVLLVFVFPNRPPPCVLFC